MLDNAGAPEAVSGAGVRSAIGLVHSASAPFAIASATPETTTLIENAATCSQGERMVLRRSSCSRRVTNHVNAVSVPRMTDSTIGERGLVTIFVHPEHDYGTGNDQSKEYQSELIAKLHARALRLVRGRFIRSR